MRLRVPRRLTVFAAAAALSLPLVSASAQSTAPAVPDHVGVAAGPVPGAQISPWGDAHVGLSAEMLRWMDSEDITLEAAGPFRLDADGRGFQMPVGAAARRGLDERGRIVYAGGLRFHHRSTGKTLTLEPTYITVMPHPRWAAAVRVGGRTVTRELPFGDTRYDEVVAKGRPSPTGFRTERAPFYVTAEASRLFADETGHSGPRVGSPFGVLTPNFDRVPGGATTPAPGVPRY
ncbi:hypothetical protein [Streptomyces sp. NPDC050560]|uniref:hypothetical protein n=1 Tax=Streptomyces sp. NPDC050560 TaxID=3365630 RepID=UPI0037961BB2